MTVSPEKPPKQGRTSLLAFVATSRPSACQRCKRKNKKSEEISRASPAPATPPDHEGLRAVRQWRMLPQPVGRPHQVQDSHASPTSSAKCTATPHPEVTLLTVITWFFRFRLSHRSTHMTLSPKISSTSARPLWRKHGPLTLLESRARRDQKSHTQVDTQECAWERRRNQDHPITKETAHRKNPARDELALTRRMTQFQEVRTPSHEEFRIHSLQTSQQLIPSPQ